MNITSQILQNIIRDKAKELGFIAFGFARYDVLENESGKLRNWIDSGYQADMDWIEKGFDKRRDISHIMPEAKSVISLAFNYFTPFEHDDNKPKISRYAWGKDYHKILKKKLKELCEVITSPPAPLLKGEGSKDYEILDPAKELNLSSPHSDFNSGNKVLLKAYVDDGPVMDKAWAQRAGIGWMGKHTNIINPEYGSWFFLCEIITNIEFELYDKPIEDMCGECSLCISACPTGAISYEYVVDSNKCISYQTIENRGEIPPDINLDGWIFGCDVCQDVCPYNSPKYNHVTGEEGFYPLKVTSYHNESSTRRVVDPSPMLIPPGRDFENASHFLEGEEGKNSELSQLDLIDMNKEQLLSISEEEFAAIFADSPVKRTKYSGWKRNLERTGK